MPGIAASEPPVRPLLASSSVALSFIDTRCTPFPPRSRTLSLSLSLDRYVPAGLQCQWTTTDSLLGSLESIRSCARVRMYVRVHVCASVIGNPGERTYLSTGNKLTSCRKLANVPWEDSSGYGRRCGGAGECGRRFRRAEEQETLLDAVFRNANSIGQNHKNFLFEIYYSWHRLL